MKNQAKIAYSRQTIGEADINSVIKVLQSDFLTQGPVVPRFESSVASYVGTQYAVATNSATSALHIACLALGVGPGDVVWTSPITFVASSNCALYCGAKVDFVDIDPLTANMSIVKLSEKLEKAKKDNSLPKVIIPVHYAGQSCEMSAIYELSLKYNFRIIEDASHSVGGCYLDKLVGACVYSDITIFSFHPVKIITTGEGGMALTNNISLFDKLVSYRSHGITSDPLKMLPRPAEEIWNYQQLFLGFNYRMTDIQAALGCSQITMLDSFVSRRREIASQYDSMLSDLPVVTVEQSVNARSSYHLYPIRIRKSICGKTQRDVYDFFKKFGIGVNLHYIPVYRQPYYEKMGFTRGYCKEAEMFYSEAISLPIFPNLTNYEQTYVIDILREILGE